MIYPFVVEIGEDRFYITEKLTLSKLRLACQFERGWRLKKLRALIAVAEAANIDPAVAVVPQLWGCGPAGFEWYGGEPPAHAE
jgi:hypothetical protein